MTATTFRRFLAFVTLALALGVAGVVGPRVSHAQVRSLTAVTVTPANPTLSVGQTEPFIGQGTFNDGSTEVMSAGGGTWAASGSLTTPRFYHTATLLQDGTVLVAGGYNGSSTFASAERYYPASGTWVSAGSMSTARLSHTATLLPNGKVLVVGGMRFPSNSLSSTTELYDPLTNSWSAGPSLTLGVRSSHSAVLLETGKVLVVAGLQSYPDCTYRASAELYDPGANTWAATGSLNLRRSSATTTLLANGKVLLAAGPQNNCPTPNIGLNEAEVYDPASGAWTVTGNLSLPRYSNTITLLPSGKVLLAGGYSAGGPTASAELYDPTTGSFSPTGALATARVATVGAGDNGDIPLLHSGQVLFAGGSTIAGTPLGSAALYDPASGTWALTGSMATPRIYNTATLLQDGKVLVVGGSSNGSIALGSAELYLPKVTWTSSNESVATIDQTGLATAVSTGTTTITVTSGSISGSTTLTVAVDTEPPTTNANVPAPNANGWNRSNVDVALDALDSGGAVSPSGVQSITYALTGAHTGGGTFNTNHTSFTISNEGTTNVTYYATDNRGNVEPSHILSIKLDKTAPTLSPLPNITVNSTSAAGAVVTFNPVTFDSLSGIDTVLVTQGLPSGSTFPHGTTSEQVTVTDKAGNSAFRSFSVIVNKTLVSIGVSPSTATLTTGQGSQQFSATGTFSDGSTQLLSAGGGTWAASSSLVTPRLYHTATLLQDGSVLVVGGYNVSSTFASAERYYPASGTWAPAGSMTTARLSHTATLLPNGKVLVVGGIRYPDNTQFNTTELYDPATNNWTAGPPLTLGVRSSHSAVLLGNGKVLVAAGLQSYPDCTYRASAELYDSNTNTWTATGSLHLNRGSATTTLLADGKVLLAGGPANNCPTPNNGLNEAEVYDPASGTWTVTGNLSLPRYSNTITLLPSGNVLLAGGISGGSIASADLYDPTAGIFSLTGSLTTARATSAGTGDNGTIPLLQSGQVLFAGGSNSSGTIVANAELYDPTSGTWATTGSLTTARTYNTATLLQDGHVLVAGGFGIGGVPLASTELYAPPGLSWASSNATAATIDQTGMATGVGTGTTTITATSGSISGSASVTVDTAVPATTATRSPAANGAGWNNTNVTVTLNATDNAGVQSITYSLNGAQAGGGTVNTPSTTFSILNEGITTVTYRATDVNGNVEPDHTLTIRLDKTAPSVANLPNLTAQATSNSGAVVTFNPLPADALSGMATVSVTPIASGSTFPHGTTNETVAVTDVAGNTTTRGFSVTVNKTLVSIAVSPPNPSVHVLQNQPFTATGMFTDGTTQVLQSGGSGGGGSGGGAGTFGQSSPMWEVIALSGMEFAPCATSQYPLGLGGSAFTSQNFFDRNGVVHETWSAGTPVVSVDGAINASDVALTLACTNGAATGTINAHWNRTRYEGTFSFNNGASTTQVFITGWSGQAPMPTARFGVGAASANGKVYAIGGVGGSCDAGGPCSFAPLATVESYNPDTNTWASEPSLNVGRESAGVAAIGSTLYVVGGHVPDGDPSGRVEIMDASSASGWTTLPQADWMPTARAGFALVTDGAYLYAIGGNTQTTNNGPVATVERYDPTAPSGSRWSTLAPMPAAGNASGAGVINGTIIVVGSDGTSRTDLYDIATGIWHNGAPMPAQRGGMSAGVTNGGLWIVGGTVNGSLAYDTLVYYPATNTQPDGWSRVGSMLTARWGLAAAVVDDVVYAIGGAATSSGAILGLSTNEALSTPPINSLSTSQGSSSNDGSNPLAVQWQSTNPSVADVDASGFANTHTVGQTTIIASVGSISCQATNGCATLTASNSTPTVQITGAVSGPGPMPPLVPGPFAIGEGAQLQLNATASDPDGDPLTYAWSIISGGGTLNQFGPQGGPTASYTNGDGPSFAVVQVTVTDSFGATAIATANITVNNVAPAVQIFGGPFSTNESQSQNFGAGGSFFDPSGNDGPWTATVNYGDGTGVQTLSVSQSPPNPGVFGNFSLNHRYADNGTFTVTVTVVDKNLGTGIATATVVVNNVVPQVFLPNSASTAVGSASNFGCVSFNDQGSADAPWTATVNYGDGSGDQMVTPTVPGSCGGGGTTIGMFNLSHAYAAGGSYTVTVKATDKDLGTGQATATVTVNAPPAVTINALGPVNEGSALNGSGSFTDASGDGPWTIKVTYGDNSGQFTLPSANSPGAFALSHVYRDNGVYTVNVQVTDSHFATGSASTNVTVNNVVPAVTLPPSAGPINEGQSFFATANFFDPGLNDSNSPNRFSATVNYGDGTAVQNLTNLNFNSSNGQGSVQLNHTYVDNPASPATTFTVTVVVTDKDGGASLPATMPVTVVNTVPGVTLFSGSQAREGQQATFTGVVFDQGANDGPWTGSVNFGDGTPTEALVLTPGAPPNSQQNTRASFTLAHTYAHAGNFNLTLTATDKDGATTPAFPWTTMAPDPHAKDVPSVAQINGKLYIHGFDRDPLGNQSSFVPRLSIYDPASNTWTIGASPSLVRAYASVGVINGKLYVAGGCVMSDCNSQTNALEIYDPATNQWSSGPAMPTARFGAAVGVIGNKLYVIGGSRVGYTPTTATEIFDPASNTWTTGTAIPVSRELPMSAVVNGELYVIGGYQRGAFTGPVARVDVFNPATGWSTRSAMPLARYAGAVGVLNGQIYVVGGADAASTYLTASQSYDPASDTWTEQVPMSTGRAYTSGGVVNNRLYVIDGTNGAMLNTNEVFSPAFSIGVEPIIVSVAIAPNPATINTPGQTVSFIATATFSDGSTQNTGGMAVPGVTWSSSNPGVATIDSTGLATAVAPGVTAIQVDAQDDTTTTVSATATLTVDFAPPLITANDASAEATSSAGAAVNFSFSATDDSDPHPIVSADHAPGATYPIGTTNVVITATDWTGKTSTKTIHVTVADTTPPSLTVPADISIVLTTASATSGVVSFTASATDTVDSAPTVSCAPASGSTFPVGTTTVSCTASDHTGHTSQPKAFKVIVAPKNAKAPKVTAPPNMTVEATGPSGAVVTFVATATDPVYGSLPVTCVPASGSTFPLGATTVVCSATNDFGKSDTDSVVIKVRDTTAPTMVSVTPSVTLLPDTDSIVPISIAVVATDVVDLAPACRISKVTAGATDLNQDGIVDWTITGALTLNIEANARRHKDRTYTIKVKCTDASGNSSSEKTAVVVSHNP